MNNSLQPGIETLKERVERVLKLARELGASAAEASASFSSGLSLTVRLREVETLEYHRDQGIGLTVYFGQRKGSASTSDLGPEALEESVRRACGLAKYAAEDPCAGLADADRLARSIPDLDLCHPWPIEPPQAIVLAADCEAAALDSDTRITNSEGATVGTSSGCSVYGNSNEFLEGYRASQHSLSCAVVAAENGQMERDYEYTVARDPADLSDPAAIGREAADRTVRRLGSTKLETRSSPVLFPARLARGLFGHLLGAISGGAQYRKTTFLLDSLDTQVFADLVSVHELPHLAKGLASAPFDSDGVATCDRSLVESGVLKGYVLGSYYARKLGMETTGNAGGIHNLVVSDTGQGFADLLAQMDKGFVVSELMGHGVNPTTGDYSRGAAGFWVENGEIQYPVNEITVAGNLRDMYRNIVAIGNDRDYRGGIRTGSVLVDGLTLAGN
ncbi:MAG: metalloprotease PmbA [Gammaproteobacteria bacterium]|nr:metalloprotease PmbA [Gammaproteobacteria bacterium]